MLLHRFIRLIYSKKVSTIYLGKLIYLCLCECVWSRDWVIPWPTIVSQGLVTLCSCPSQVETTGWAHLLAEYRPTLLRRLIESNLIHIMDVSCLKTMGLGFIIVLTDSWAIAYRTMIDCACYMFRLQKKNTRTVFFYKPEYFSLQYIYIYFFNYRY